KRMFLTAVPCLATILEPFTFKSLINTTESPVSKITPFTSLWMIFSLSSKPSLVALAKAKVSSSKYSISNKSCGQPSFFKRDNNLQATTCTALYSLHILSFKQRQWFGSVFSGFSIWSIHVLQANKLPSTPPADVGGTSYILRLLVAEHNSHFEPLLSCNSFIKLIIIIYYCKNSLNGLSPQI